jgi:hypothetical protein
MAAPPAVVSAKFRSIDRRENINDRILIVLLMVFPQMELTAFLTIFP